MLTVGLTTTPTPLVMGVDPATASLVMPPVPPVKVASRVAEAPETTVSGVAEKTVMLGSSTEVAVMTPAVEAVPARLVATQLRPTVPATPAVKVTLLVAAPAVMVPFVMLQAKVTPAWGVPTEAI